MFILIGSQLPNMYRMSSTAGIGISTGIHRSYKEKHFGGLNQYTEKLY